MASGFSRFLTEEIIINFIAIDRARLSLISRFTLWFSLRGCGFTHLVMSIILFSSDYKLTDLLVLDIWRFDFLCFYLFVLPLSFPLIDRDMCDFGPWASLQGHCFGTKLFLSKTSDSSLSRWLAQDSCCEPENVCLKYL